MNDLINKIGVDKLLHFSFGGLITACIANFIFLQCELSVLLCTLIGIVVTMILEFIKEYKLDSSPDWKDILATFLGCLLVLVVNALGILFNVVF